MEFRKKNLRKGTNNGQSSKIRNNGMRRISKVEEKPFCSPIIFNFFFLTYYGGDGFYRDRLERYQLSQSKT